jgi:hypothetical protein
VEVVIGVILLIGAFALGHSSADHEAAENRSVFEGNQVVESPDDGTVPQGCRYRVDGPTQRDLTLPYARQESNDSFGAKETPVACCSD